MADQAAPSKKRRPLTRDRVLRAAVTLADKHGGVPSMRVLAKKRGVAAMSLYNHVSNKEDLLDGMVDLVWAEIDLPSAEKDWTLAMRERTRSVIEALRRHPWAVGLMEGRAKPGPANLQHHNDVLGCLRRAGFSPKDSVHVMSLFDSFMYGFALQQRTLALDTREDFEDAAVRQSTQVAALAERFPHLAEVVAGHVATEGYDYAEELEFGLDVLIEGLRAYTEERSRAALHR
jgi:AcrR family transcriptional regulator